MKKCTKCKAIKPLGAFAKDSSKNDGKNTRCKDCDNERIRQWRSKNPKKVKAWRERWEPRRAEYWRKWRKKHLADELVRKRIWQQENKDKVRAQKFRRRASKASASGFATANQILARWDYYGGLCYLCGAEATAMDHVKPLTMGGAAWPCNLRPICKPCNSSKGNQWPHLCDDCGRAAKGLRTHQGGCLFIMGAMLMSDNDVIEIRDTRDGGWFWADNELIDKYGETIGAHGIAVYVTLARHANNNKCWPSIGTIGKKIGASRPTVKKALDALQAVGLITVLRRRTDCGDSDTNLYTLERIKVGGQGDYLPGQGDYPRVGKEFAQGGQGGLHEQDLLNKTKKNKTKTRAQKKAPTDPRIKQFVESFQETVGYDLTTWPVEMKAAKSILQCYTVEDALACWRYMQTDPFWEGKHCGLMTVHKNLGPWIKAGKPKTNGKGKHEDNQRGRAKWARSDTCGWTTADAIRFEKERNAEEAARLSAVPGGDVDPPASADGG